MLTHSELKELAAIRPNEKLFISLYLNVNPLTNPKGDYIIHFKNMAKELLDKIGRDTEKKVKNAIDKIESHLKGNKRELKKGIALICSSDLEIWKNYNLSLPVKNEIIVDNTPYIQPLVFLLNNYPRCVVLLVDRELAKIFIVHLGEIKEYTELFTPDIPGKHKKGDWFSLSQKRFERHIDYHVGIHIKEVVKALEDFLHKESMNNIIIGGSEDAVTKVKNILPQAIIRKVISTFNAETFLGEKEVLNKTLKVLEELEGEKQKNMAEELITKAMKNNMAVIGIEDVLGNLQEGKVMKLVFLKDLTAVGFKCSNCGFLTVQTIKSCPYCGGKFEGVHYLIDYTAQKAVEQGALIEIITKSDELVKAGGIGAFLRF
ncbi:MAG: Vms1/Ankzf1 family peptidyl-tRNA hydrolase [Nitrospirota bacterium]